MELKYLKEFVLLAQVRHFQEAADALFISQSTLSKHIKAIESELKEELFIRSSKRTELSDFGKHFLPYAKEILNIQQEYTSELLQDYSSDNRVSFGCMPMVTLYSFLPFFTDFVKKNPSVKYNIIEGSSHCLLTLLLNKRVDFILTHDISLPVDEYQKVLYTRDHLVAILPANHPLAACENVHIEDLEAENLITFAGPSDTEHFLRHIYPDANFRMTFTVEKEAFLFKLVQQGLGISVTANWPARHYAMEGTVVKDIYPLAYLDIYMIYSKNRSLSTLTKDFAAYLKHNAPPKLE